MSLGMPNLLIQPVRRVAAQVTAEISSIRKTTGQHVDLLMTVRR